MAEQLFVGIDPCARKGAGFGVVVYSPQYNDIRFFSLRGYDDFVLFAASKKRELELAKENGESEQEFFFAVENSNLQKEIFNEKHIIGAAKNQVVSQMTVNFLIKTFGKKYVYQYSPKAKGAKIIDNTVFLQYIKQCANKEDLKIWDYNNKSQDQRDAAKLALLLFNHVKLFGVNNAPKNNIFL